MTIDNLNELTNLKGESLLVVRSGNVDYRYPISSLIQNLLYNPTVGNTSLGASSLPFEYAYITNLTVGGSLFVSGTTALTGLLTANGGISTGKINTSTLCTTDLAVLDSLTVNENSTLNGEVIIKSNVTLEADAIGSLEPLKLTSPKLIASTSVSSPDICVSNILEEVPNQGITLKNNLTQADSLWVSSSLFKGALTSKDSDGKLKLYIDGTNEINFGGTQDSHDSIYFGKTSQDKTKVPSTYIFGSTEAGTATLKAKTLNCDDSITTPELEVSTKASIKELEVTSASRFEDSIKVDKNVTALKFIGALEGNASTATQWEKSFTLKITSDASDSVITGSRSFKGSELLDEKDTSKGNGTTLDLTVKEATTSTKGLLSASDKKKLDTLDDYRAIANTWSKKQAFTANGVVEASSSYGAGTLNVTGGIIASSGIKGSKVYNAVWNDLADCIPVDGDCELIYGYCYCFDGNKYYRSHKYLDDGIIGIHSDTYGMHMGYKRGLKQMNVAVAGFALAFVDKEYAPGTALTCGENGYLTEILREDRIEHPEKIVATYWKKENEEYWGSDKEKVKVGGRVWVRIR